MMFIKKMAAKRVRAHLLQKTGLAQHREREHLRLDEESTATGGNLRRSKSLAASGTEDLSTSEKVAVNKEALDQAYREQPDKGHEQGVFLTFPEKSDPILM